MKTTKKYHIMYGIGKAKYVVSHWDGIKTHKDGSSFYDVTIFKNKQKLGNFVNNLRKDGYQEEG